MAGDAANASVTSIPGTPPLLELIAERQITLRRSERKVADVVLGAPAQALSSTMAQLAALADVSEPTVMRFCNAVGADGFQSFKMQLAQALALGLPPTHSAITTQDNSAELIAKVFDHTITSLDRARRALDPVKVDAAIDELVVATSIFFIGYGASGIIALDAQQKFPLFGVPCDAYVDGHQQFMAASMSGPGSVCVAISNTGRTVGILAAVAAAKDQGARVIGIAGQVSPLLDASDVPLLVSTFEDTDVFTPTTSRLAGLAVIDILATGVAMRLSPSHRRRLREMKQRLSNLRTGRRPHSKVTNGRGSDDGYYV